MSEPVIKHGKVQTKPVAYLRRKPNIKELVKEHSNGELTDLGMKHKVKIAWNLNKQAQKDKVFKLQIDDKVVYLDLEELTFYTRAMFI